MSIETEQKIKDLLAQALVVKGDQEVERVMSELQKALEEHVRHAKVNLAYQASSIQPKAPEMSPTPKAKSATP